MGVGTPRDLREAVARGVDMFDCVLPTRLARHGVAVTDKGNLNLLNARFKRDFTPLDPSVVAPLARLYTCLRSPFVQDREILARLLTYHNLYFYQAMMRRLRVEIMS